MIIYKATNKINGKCYIGQTVKSLQDRMNEHIMSSIRKDGYYFQRAIRKYTKDNFIWEVIEDTCQSIDELNEMEFHYIKQYHSREYENGYNLTDGGDGTHGYVPDTLTRKKMSVAKKGILHSEEHKKKISETLKGHKMSDKTRKKIGKANKISNKGKVFSHKHRYNMSKMYQIIHPDGKCEDIVGLDVFCLQNGLNTSNMVQVAKGKRNHHKKYRCKYII